MPDQTYWAETLVRSREELSQLLRAARESLGVPLSEVAAALKIREPYLRAIEEARFGDLPGPIYATAFLRSYAAHVGYSGDDVVAAWRQLDPAGEEAHQSHKFRILESERRLPRLTMVLLSVLLLAGAYAVWNWIGREDVAPVPPVAEVPAHLRFEPAPAAMPVVMTGNEPAKSFEARPAEAVVAVPANPTGREPVANAVAARAAASAREAVPAAEPSAAPMANGGRDRASTALPQPTAAGDPRSRSAAPVPPSAAAPPPTASVPQASVPPPARGAIQPSSAPAAAVPPQPATEPRPPAAVANPAAPARVEPAQPRDRTIRVSEPTLLELRDAATGEVLATVNMRTGDSYTVPSHIAYSLRPDR